MKQGRLTPIIVILILSLVIGFSLLSVVSKPSVPLMVVVGLLLIVLSILLIRYAVIFDRQIQQKREEQDETEITQ